MGNVLGAHTLYTSLQRDSSHSVWNCSQKTRQGSALVEVVSRENSFCYEVTGLEQEQRQGEQINAK
jgi:hypothetical protein